MSTGRHLIDQATVYLGQDLEPTEGMALLIENGSIVRIGPSELLRPTVLPQQVIDYPGCHVVPGLIDCHSHLSLDCSLENYLGRMNGSETELAIIATKTMVKDLRSGVTTSRCMGDRFYIDVFCRKAVEDGFVVGPQLKVSGIGMRASHGHGFVGMPFDGEKMLRQAVRSNIKQGVDWIKFYSTGTAIQPDGQVISYYTREEIAAIIEEAHQAGTPVTSHCIGGQAMHDCIDLGIDCIEHAYYADSSHLEALRNSGTMVCLTPSEYFTDKPHMPPKTQETFRKCRPTVQQSMEMIVQSGISFVLGTDGMHGELAMEARYAVGFGADPRTVLQSLTSRAARFLGLGHETGSIETGKCADLVVIEDDPLKDMLNLKRIRQVYKSGLPIRGILS